MKICHNCKGTGNIDGGSQKRISKQIKKLESQKQNEENKIRNSELKKEQKQMKLNEIESRYNKLLNEKSNEDFTLSKCIYCNGTGRIGT